MKKSGNLPLRLLIGVIAGAALGLLIPQGSTLLYFFMRDANIIMS